MVMVREPGTGVVGIDQSTATAAVALDERGEFRSQVWVAKTKKHVKEYPGEAYEPVVVKGGNERARLLRTSKIEEMVRGFVRTVNPFAVAFELHNFTGTGEGARILAEVTGVLKLSITRIGYRLRGYDSDAVKIFSTGKGNAEKADIILAVRDLWGRDYLPLGIGNQDPGSNLADAYVLARILWTELELRSGRLSLSDLPERERRVFLRTTKNSPVNILDNEFLTL